MSSFGIVCFAFQVPPVAHLHPSMSGRGEHLSLLPSYILTHDNLCYFYVISYAYFFFCLCTLYVKSLLLYPVCAQKDNFLRVFIDMFWGCDDVIGNKMCLSLKLRFIHIYWMNPDAVMTTLARWHSDVLPNWWTVFLGVQLLRVTGCAGETSYCSARHILPFTWKSKWKAKIQNNYQC